MALGLTRQRAGGRRRAPAIPEAAAAFSVTKSITVEFAEVVDV